MYLLCELTYPREHIGQLAVLEQTEESPVYVVSDITEDEKEVTLVQLDRPQDSIVTLKMNDCSIYLLEPVEVIERVHEWN